MAHDNPFGPQESIVIKCPKCGESDFDAKQNQYETWRECRKCGNRWSGGSMGARQPDFSLPENKALVPPPGVPDMDEDLPVVQYTGAPFRRGGFEPGDD